MNPLALILLLLPLGDALVLLPLGRLIGLWLWAWIAGGALFGILLLRSARDSARRQGAAGRTSGAGLEALLDNRRTVLAGLLLIWPGLLSDLAAITLLVTAPPASVGDRWEHPLALQRSRQAFVDRSIAQSQA